MTVKNSMKSGSIGRHLLVMLALGAGCYFGVTALYHQIDSRFMSNSVGSELLETAAVLSDRSAEPAGQIDREVINRRNIFLPKKSTRQGNDATNLMESLVPSKAELVLVGTIVENGSGSRAVIYDMANEKQRLLKEGDVINGASIRQISSGKVVISRQGKNELLDIAEARELRALNREMPGQAAAVIEFSAERSGEMVDKERNGADSGLKIDINRLGEIRSGINIKGRFSKKIE